MVIPILSIAPHRTPKIWMPCDGHTPKILNMKLRRVVIARGGISSCPGLQLKKLKKTF